MSKNCSRSYERKRKWHGLRLLTSKASRGGAGTRSTSVFFNNSSSELDGDLKIAPDGTLYVCNIPVNLYPRVTGLPKTLGTDPGVMVTEPSPGTYRFKGSTKTAANAWANLQSSVHLDAGTYTLDASDWPYDSISWLIGIQSTLTPDDGSERANVFEPRDYGPKTLKAGTLRCNIFVNTTGEVDKTFTPRLYKID